MEASLGGGLETLGIFKDVGLSQMACVKRQGHRDCARGGHRGSSSDKGAWGDQTGHVESQVSGFYSGARGGHGNICSTAGT